MKKILLVLFVLIGSTITVNAQQTVVLQNQQTSPEQTTDPNIKYINGIPSTQDIGGVDLDQPDYKEDYIGTYYDRVVFTNYNQFPVTVLYKLIYKFKSGRLWSHVGSIVLPPASNYNFPSKEVAFGDRFSRKVDVMTITRKVGN